jgi:hypothetical protein
MGAPILIIAYNREKNLVGILKDVEELSTRNVHISIDGSTEIPRKSNLVFAAALEYQKYSKHNVSTQLMSENLGLLGHFRKALNDFFHLYDFGVVFEDDMEFHFDFINYIDLNLERLSNSELWSVCGHNPAAKNSFKADNRLPKIEFFYTGVHTIWGWASSRRSINAFDSFLSIPEVEFSRVAISAIERQSKFLTRNLLLRKLFVGTWTYKLDRNLKSARPNWDNLWVIAGWHFNRLSLMPNIALTEEGRDQASMQTHVHKRNKSNLHTGGIASIEDLAASPRKILKSRERALIKVWGISNRRALRNLFFLIRERIQK